MHFRTRFSNVEPRLTGGGFLASHLSLARPKAMRFQTAAVILPAMGRLTPQRLQRDDPFSKGDSIRRDQQTTAHDGAAVRIVFVRAMNVPGGPPPRARGRHCPQAGGSERRVAPPI